MDNRLSNDLDALLDRQKEAWVGGARPRAEDLLNGSSFPNDSEVLLDLLYNEVVLREELGESPAAAEYILRYPHLTEDIKLHFEVHAALHADLVSDTRRVRDAQWNGDNYLSPSDISPTLRDYEIIALLGRGGMGVVYKARHRRLNRLVALKMFQPGRVPSPRELARFQTEAEAIARLQHPNIVQIFEVGRSKGYPFLALELAGGDTLARKLQNLPFAPKDAAELVKTLAHAVQHAHSRQIVHRDLKPANVLFTSEDTPKITDFGLAKMLEESDDSPRDATRTGEPMGTPRYMAPEQTAGRPDLIGPATDIYALGTLLYECLTGQVPFVAASAMATMEKIRTDAPTSPRRLQRTIPRDLDTICMKCLHKQPARRYPDAEALADDLGRFLQGEPIRARPTPVWERVWMWSWRRPAAAVLIAAALLAAVVGAAGYGVHQHWEAERVRQLRDDLAGMMRDGQAALSNHDDARAQERFLSALTLVRGEPALADQELSVAGWLDHSRRSAEQERWRQRRPPPLFDELRDEALVQCLVLDHSQKDPTAARETIQAALALTVADDPAWGLEREQLTLLDADLVLREGNAAAALALLDQAQGIESRLWQDRRADCLDRLDRKAEADQARQRAAVLSPTDTRAWFLSGVDRLDRKDLSGAVGDFDRLLTQEPDHFMARLFQAACFQRQKRLGEAKVALTACLGQRPHFAWTCLLLGQIHLQENDPIAALQDFQRGLDMNPRDAARTALLVSRGFVQLRRDEWDLARADFDQALAVQPDAAEVRLGRGLALLAQGNYDESVADTPQIDAHQPPAMQVLCARIFARAAQLVPAKEGDAKHAGKKALYESQAVSHLRLALEQVPAPDRQAFWNETIRADATLSPLGGFPEFEKRNDPVQEEPSDSNASPHGRP